MGSNMFLIFMGQTGKVACRGRDNDCCTSTSCDTTMRSLMRRNLAWTCGMRVLAGEKRIRYTWLSPHRTTRQRMCRRTERPNDSRQLRRQQQSILPTQPYVLTESFVCDEAERNMSYRGTLLHRAALLESCRCCYAALRASRLLQLTRQAIHSTQNVRVAFVGRESWSCKTK